MWREGFRRFKLSLGGGYLRVLVVDDASSWRQLFHAVLQARGHDVLLAESASRAIELLDERPDVISLDLAMPPDHGFLVIEHLLRTDPERLRCVLVVTAMPTDVDMLLGGMTILHKPFELDAYVRAVEAAGQGSTAPQLSRLGEWRSLMKRMPGAYP